MSNEKEGAERKRKVRSAKGTRSQRMMSFRIDNDVADWLESKENKGRCVNDTLRSRMKYETTMT